MWWAACFMLVCLCNRSRVMRRSCSSHKSICTGHHFIISQSRTGWEVREAMLYWPWNELLLSETRVCCLESSLVFHKILLCALLKSVLAMLSKLMVAYYFTSYLIFHKFPTDQKLLQVIELFFCMTCGWVEHGTLAICKILMVSSHIPLYNPIHPALWLNWNPDIPNIRSWNLVEVFSIFVVNVVANQWATQNMLLGRHAVALPILPVCR